MLSDKEAMEVYCHFNSIKVRLELKTDASDFVIPENFNSIKVRLER